MRKKWRRCFVCVDVWKCITFKLLHIKAKKNHHWHRDEWHFLVENGNKFVTLVSQCIFFCFHPHSFFLISLCCVLGLCVCVFVALIPFFLDSVITYVAKRRYHFCTFCNGKSEKQSAWQLRQKEMRTKKLYIHLVNASKRTVGK